MDLLLFFALPVATIILAIVWQKIIKCPILVAATAFAIFLIVSFVFFDSDFLIFVIIYTILAFIAAWITKFICQNFGRNGWIRTINAENINTDRLNANIFEVNDGDDDDDNHHNNHCHHNNDNDNENDGCHNNNNCNCNCCCNRCRCSRTQTRNFYRR